MKSIRIILAAILILPQLFSCSNNKADELAKLKKQQSAITGKIKVLENNIDLSNPKQLDTTKFKFVLITDVRKNVFDHYVKVQGKLDGDQNVAVFADVPGTVTHLFANVGNVVSRDQVLAQIDDQQYRKQYEGLLAQYKFADDLYQKQKRLWDQKIGSEVQYLQSKTNKESLEQQIEALKDQIEKFKIKSPVDGTIEECNIKVGSVVSPDPRSAAYRVVAFRNLKVSAEVSEAYADNVQSGDRVIIVFPDIKKQLETKVDFVSRYINPLNRTFIIESRIPDRFSGMKANMVAVIQINDYHSESSIQIPMNVIQTDQDGSYVYVIRKKDQYNGAYKQPVVIGNIYNGIAEIIQGLSVNDKVITTGFQELINGEYVRINHSF